MAPTAIQETRSKPALGPDSHPFFLLHIAGNDLPQTRTSISKTLTFLNGRGTSERGRSGTVRSVVGTIRIAEADQDLSTGDNAIRALFLVTSSHRGGTGLLGRRRTAKQRPILTRASAWRFEAWSCRCFPETVTSTSPV